MVNLSAYAVNGKGGGLDSVLFGSQATVGDLDELNKALSAEEITGRETTNLTTASGAPLKVESLDRTLKVLTYQQKDVVFWKNIAKTAAFNTVEEYNQLQSYGQDTGGFAAEGELPQEEDSVYVRRAQLVKFMGTTRAVTHPMSLVNTMVGDVVKREIDNGTLWLLRKLDKGLFFADSTKIPEEFNGIFTQHQQNDAFTTLDQYMASNTVIDKRGQPMTEKDFENGAEGIVENFGLGTEFFCPPRVLSDFVKVFYGNKFIQPNTPALTDGVMGQKVKSFESQFGDIGLNWDIFMNPPAYKYTTSQATSNLAPAAPTVGGTPTNLVTGAQGSLFATTDAGNYYYAVSAKNKYGVSALTVLSSTATAVVAGSAVDLQFTATAGPNPTSSYDIYRSQINAPNSTTGAVYSLLFSVSVADLAAGYDGAAAGAIRDKNRWVYGGMQALLAQNDNQVLEFKQLAPLMKMDLAIVSPAYRFMILLYGTPFLYAPQKVTRYINIGVAA